MPVQTMIMHTSFFQSLPRQKNMHAANRGPIEKPNLRMTLLFIITLVLELLSTLLDIMVLFTGKAGAAKNPEMAADTTIWV